MALVMISSELPEILGMSDRILVLREGHAMGELSRAEATEEKIMTLATGITKNNRPQIIIQSRKNAGRRLI